MAKFDVDEALVRKLADLMEETGLTEVEYELGDQRIHLSRAGSAQPAPQASAPPQAPKPPAQLSSEEDVPAGAVTAPMVGTVYTSPQPGAAPYVKAGDTVTEGQTLMIIEAMKVMNQIPSPRSGKVTQVMVADGQPVEFGEPLLVIE